MYFDGEVRPFMGAPASVETEYGPKRNRTPWQWLECRLEQNTVGEKRKFWKSQAKLHRGGDVGNGSCIKHGNGKNRNVSC